MKNARVRRAGDSDGFGKSLARQIDLEYIRNALDRSEFTDEEVVGLGHALWGVTYAKTHALEDNERQSLQRLSRAIEAGTLPTTAHAAAVAKALIQGALSGDREAKARMLDWARREGI